MKKISMILSIALLAFVFTGCGSSGDTSSTPNTPPTTNNEGGDTEELVFEQGQYGEISITADYKIPGGALFLDIRDDWERVSMRAVGSVGGAIYEYRGENGSKVLNEEFYNQVLVLAGDESREIILICQSSSRTRAASQELSNRGFSNVSHILGGTARWAEVKPTETIFNTNL